MKRYIWIACMVLFATAAKAQAGNYSVILNTSGLHLQAKAILRYQGKKDTAYSSNSFEFKGNIDHPGVATIYVYYPVNGRSVIHYYLMFLSPGKTVLDIVDPHGKDSVMVTENKLAMDYQNKLWGPVSNWNDKIADALKSYHRAQDVHSADTSIYLAAFHNAQKSCFQVPKDFIRGNPNSPLSIIALGMLGKASDPRLPVSLQELNNLYDSLSDDLKKSVNGRQYAVNYLNRH